MRRGRYAIWMHMGVILALVVGMLHLQAPRAQAGVAPVLTGSGVTPTYSIGEAAVAVDPGITLSGPEIDMASVTITTNLRFGDQLSMAPQSGISAWWDSYTGVLTLSGTATASDYQAALRSVTFRTTSGDSSPRTVTFAIGNALYSPATGHFYEFVYSPWIDWYSAEGLAEDIVNYGQPNSPSGVYGLQGYLVTVTSQAENDFVSSKLQGQGWMGASDDAVEGVWRWVTGPEAGTQFSQQQLGSTGTSVNGMYIHWDVGEPNDADTFGEHYGHFWENGYWNDYAYDNTSIEGYVVEYGGMPGDPSLQLFAETTVLVDTNTAPVISAVPDQETPHDTVLGPIPFTIGDAEQSADLLTLVGSSSNPGLVPHESITFGGSGSNRTASVTPAAGQSGEAYITMTVTDNEGATAQTTFLLSVPVNYAPVLTAPSNQPALPSIMEDEPAGAGAAVSTLLTGQVSDADPGDTVGMAVTDLDESHGHWEYSANGGATWTAALVSSSNALLLAPTDSLRFVPAPDFAGDATITYRAWDQSDGLNAGDRTNIESTGGTAAYSASTQSAIVTVTAVNDGPVLAGPASAVVQEEVEQWISGIILQDVDAGNQPMSLYVSVSHGTLAFSTTDGLILNSGDYTGSSLDVTGTQTDLQAALDSLTYLGGDDYYGPDSLVVGVSDQGWSGAGEPIFASLTVPITVSNVEDPPSPGGDATVVAPGGGPVSVPEDQPMPEGPNIRLMVPTLSDPDGQTPTAIRILSVTGGQLLAADGTPITLGTPGTILSLTDGYLDLRFAPTPDRDSDASFQYMVVDPTEAHINSAPSVATVPVSPVNDAPTVSTISSQTTAEDQPLDVTLSFQDIDSPVEAMSCTATAADPALVPGVNLTCTITGATTGVLRLTPAPDLSGTTSIQVVLSDGTAQGQTAFDLAVTPVNDPSTISPLADTTMNQDAGPLLLPFALSDSDSDLAGLIPSASSSDPLLFPPGSITFGGEGADRTISLTPAAGLAGEATITVQVTDSADSSLAATTSFRVTVRSAPAAPAWNSPAASETVTDTVALSVTSATYGGAEYAALFEVYGDSGYTDLKTSLTGAQVAGGTPSTTTWTVDLPRGTYYLRATVTDTWGMSSAFVPLGALTVNRAPAVPTGLSPSAGTLQVDQISFAATYSDPDADTGAVRFELFPTSDYSGPSALSLTGTTVNTGEASTVDWEVALPAGTYYLRAAAQDSAGAASPYAAVGAITLDRTPGAPVGLAPSGGSWVTTTQPTLSWAHNDPDGDSQTAYQIIIRDGAGNMVLDTGTVSTGSMTYTVDEAVLGDAPDAYRWTVRTWDADGVMGPYAAESLMRIDATPPSGSAVINGGSAQTNETGVTLTLSATDATSGQVQMRFAMAGDPWGTWEPYATVWAWTLPTGDGSKEIQIQFRDAAGNLSAITSASILLDTTEPMAQVTVPGSYLNSLSLPLTWTADDGLGSGVASVTLYLSTNGGATWDQYGETVTSSPIIFSVPVDGTYAFALRAVDQAGNAHAAPAGPGDLQASLVVDATKPEGSIQINHGAEATSSTDATLTLSASDATAGVKEMRLSTDGTTWTAWEPYNSSRNFTLSAGEGTKTVYAQYRDWAGNESDPTTATIHLDQTAPSAEAAALAPYQSTRTVPVAWTADDGTGSGVLTVELYYSADGGSTWARYGSTFSTSPIDFTAPADGPFAFSLRGIDAAGNAEPAPTGIADLETTAMIDTGLPSGTIRIDGDLLQTNSGTVPLVLTATDGTSGVAEMQFSDDGILWTGWEPYAESRIYTLPPGDGIKQVWVRFRDRSGNLSTGNFAEILLDQTPPIPTALSVAPYQGSTSVPVTWSSSDGSGAGVASARLYVSQDGGEHWILYGGPYTTATIGFTATTDGPYAFHLRLKDTLGNESPEPSGAEAIQATTTVDTAKPSVSISIEDGAAQTNSRAVTLTLAVEDLTAGVQEMRFSDDRLSWTNWEPIGTERAYTLPDLDGLREVAVQVRDRAGNLSDMASAQIVLDTAPPVATVTAQPGVQRTRSFDIYWSGDDGTGTGLGSVKLYYSTDDGTTWTQYSDTFNSSPIPFTAPQQTQYLFNLRGADVAGNEEAEPAGPESAEASTRVSLPTPAPLNPPTGTVSMNDGAPFTRTPGVTLTLTVAADQPGTIQMRFSDDGTSWSGWEPYRSTSEYTLPAGSGPKTIHVQFRRSGESLYTTTSASILLDGIPPSAAVQSPGEYLSAQQVTLAWSGNDGGGSGIESVTLYVSTDHGQTWRPTGSAYTTSPIRFTAAGDGTYLFSLQATDRAGNAEPAPAGPAAAEATVTVDQTPPEVTVDQPEIGEDEVIALTGTAEPGVTLEIAVDEEKAGQIAGDSTWAYRLPELTDGMHRITVTATDHAGNVTSLSLQVMVGNGDPIVVITWPTAEAELHKLPVVRGTATTGATVTVTAGGHEVAAITVGENGTWQADLAGLDGTLPPGEVTVAATAVDQQGKAGTDSVSFVYSPGGTISGLVLDQTGYPVAGAELLLADSIGELVDRATSDQSGAFAFAPVPFGEYTLSTPTAESRQVTVSGEEGSQATLVVAGSTHLSLSAEPSSIPGDGTATTTIRLSLIGPNGQPRSGVRIAVSTTGGQLSASEAVTGPDGQAVVLLTAPRVDGITPERLLVQARAEAGSGDPIEQSIAIDIVPATISGVLLDQGRPVVGAVVEVAEDFDADGRNDFTARTLSGSDGSYRIGVPRGHWVYHIVITATTQVQGETVTMRVEQEGRVGEIASVGEVFPATRTVGGQVLVAGPGHAQPATVDQVFGQGATIQAHLETAGGLTVDHPVQVRQDGTYQTRDLPPGEYRIIFRVASPDGQELAGATAIVAVDQEGVLEMDAPLIDPFGVVTSASTGEPLSGVGLHLFWADTPLNREQGREPDTEVILPRLPGFAPNDNANPQATDASGAYAWMVFPDADYYIVAEVDGYKRYDSRQEGRDVAAAPGEDSYISDGIVHVGATIVRFDIALQPLHERHDGFVTGYPDGTFRPDQPITRAEVAAVVARLFEFAEDPSTTVGFGDLSDEHWARAYIAALSQRGIMVGFNDGNFHPDQPVTRAELAAVVARLQGLDPQMGDAFADTRGHWAQGVVEAARQAGAVTGFTDGLYHPEEPATRAQFVAMVARMLGRGPLTGLPTPTWPDVSADHWAFGYVEEASADHLFDPLPEGAGEQWAGVPEE